MSDERLHTDLLGIAMKTPVLTASGTFGFGEEFKDFTASASRIRASSTSSMRRCRAFSSTA